MFAGRLSTRFLFGCVVLSVANCQLPGIRLHPTDTIAILGDTTTLQCRATTEPTDAKLLWYKNGVTIGENDTFSDDLLGRFSIDGDWTKGVYDLEIKDTQIADSGEYYCQFLSLSEARSSTSNIAILTVIQPSETWYPKCVMYIEDSDKNTQQRLASSGFIVGDKVAVECISSGEPVPELIWKEDGRLVPGELLQNYNLSSAVNTFSWTLSERDDGALYVCSVNLPTLSRSPFCTIGPLDVRVMDKSGVAMIPAIITGALAAVAVILFFVVVILLFKYRQCKLCRDLPDFHEPVQVAMPESVGRLPSPISSSEIDEDDDYDDDNINVLVHDAGTSDVGQSSMSSPSAASPNDEHTIPKLQTSSIIRNIDSDETKQGVQKTDPISQATSTGGSRGLDNQSIHSDSPNANVELDPEPSTSFRPPPPIPTDSASHAGDTSPRVLELEEDSIYYIPKELHAKKGKTQDKKKEKKQRKKEKEKVDKKRKKDPDYIDDPVVYAEINFSKDVGMNIIIEDKDLNN